MKGNLYSAYYEIDTRAVLLETEPLHQAVLLALAKRVVSRLCNILLLWFLYKHIK